jgi:hypothetical protein
LPLKISLVAAAVLLWTTASLSAECGVDKPFQIYVRKSFHADKIAVPTSGCKTVAGPCKASGTIFIVSSKSVKYTMFLPDGSDGNLEVGERYSAVLTCGKNPMMTVTVTKDGNHTAGFYVVEQEAETPKK